jgi:hypothetical protein
VPRSRRRQPRRNGGRSARQLARSVGAVPRRSAGLIPRAKNLPPRPSRSARRPWRGWALSRAPRSWRRCAVSALSGLGPDQEQPDQDCQRRCRSLKPRPSWTWTSNVPSLPAPRSLSAGEIKRSGRGRLAVRRDGGA